MSGEANKGEENKSNSFCIFELLVVEAEANKKEKDKKVDFSTYCMI